jgi:hypothetical protein
MIMKFNKRNKWIDNFRNIWWYSNNYNQKKSKKYKRAKKPNENDFNTEE